MLAVKLSRYFWGINPFAKKINSVESYFRTAPHFEPWYQTGSRTPFTALRWISPSTASQALWWAMSKRGRYVGSFCNQS